MTLFVDASALVTILMDEPGAEGFVAAIAVDTDPIWSAMTCWESVSALQNSYGIDVVAARFEVERIALDRPFRLVQIGQPELNVALDAYQRYGKGRHPARLNMGDCFSYGCAKANHARLLYKGDDFAKTDLA